MPDIGNNHQEGFNPEDFSSPKEMPESVQRRFKAVPEDGFVREMVHTIEKYEGKNPIKRLLGEYRYRHDLNQEIDRTHEEAKALDDAEEAKHINDMLRSGDTRLVEAARKAKQLRSAIEEKLRLIAERKQQLISDIRQTAQEPFTEAWKEIGHSGALGHDTCGQDCCDFLYGTIDGKAVNVKRVYSKYEGTVDGVELSNDTARALLEKYQPLAANEKSLKVQMSDWTLDRDQQIAQLLQENDVARQEAARLESSVPYETRREEGNEIERSDDRMKHRAPMQEIGVEELLK